MTTEQAESISFKRFSNSVLPWIVLGGALILYLVTLNHWVTLTSLPIVAKVTGWDWTRPLGAPVYYLITLPVRWLPATWQIISLNFLSAVCASLTLALLARSVALLPHDRTREQRLREHDEFSLLSIRWAWIPVVLAAMICGLQVTFWENATVASGEMIDLLIFAYVIRCLLEFRLTDDDRWLYKMALVYGIGMTNNWAMVGFFPLALVAVIWIRGLSFFQGRFLVRFIGFGLIGASLYLLLPVVGAMSDSGFSFWEIIKANLAYQKRMTLGNPFIGGLKFDFLTMSLTSLVPILLVGARWTADYADISAVGSVLTNLMFRLLHLTLLVFCVWTFFDYKFSPRILGRGVFSFLTLYYLSAISVGYLCGYVLLVFGHEGERAWGKSRSSFRYLNKAIAFITGVGVLCIPFWLAYRTFHVLSERNGPALKTFARRMASTLPANALVLSDDPVRLYVMQALDATEQKERTRVYLNTGSLFSRRYHNYLRNSYPKEEFFHVALKDDLTSALPLIEMIERLRRLHPVYYLHPSFGFYFEQYYPRQRGLAFELMPFAKDQLTVPPLEEKDIDANEAFWKDISPKSLKALTELAETVSDAAMLCTYYSCALNAWGVELQRNNQLKPAEESFYIAWNLDPNNVIAQINGRYNVNTQKGNREPLKADDDLIKQLNALHGLTRATFQFGPIDEPGACFFLGEIFRNGGNLRQSAQQFARVATMMPDDPTVRLKFARILVDLQKPDWALLQVRDAKAVAKNQPAFDLEIADLESRILLLKDDFDAAENLVMERLEANLDREEWHQFAYQFYTVAAEKVKDNPNLFEQRLKKAIGILDHLIESHPDDRYRLNKALVLAQMGKREEGIGVLTQILKSNPQNSDALVNRAIFKLQDKRYEEARQDYLLLEKMTGVELFRVYYGLAQVAEGMKDFPSAIRNYEAYLKTAPLLTQEYRQVSQRLKELRDGKRT